MELFPAGIFNAFLLDQDQQVKMQVTSAQEKV